MADEQAVLDKFRSMLSSELEVRAIWTKNDKPLLTRVVVNKTHRMGMKVVVNLNTLVVIEHKPPQHAPGMRSWSTEENPRTKCDTLEECVSVVKTLFD